MIEYFLMTVVAAGAPIAQSTLAQRPPTQTAQPAQDAGASGKPGDVPPAREPSTQAVSPVEFKNPVNITADRFEIQGKRQEAVWSGNVKAVRGKTVLTCHRLIAHFTKSQEIRRIECVDNVVATHEDMWARGERADFDNIKGLLVVTGSPEAKKGGNRMRGQKITVDITRDVITVDKAITESETGPTQLLPKGGGR